MPNLSRYRQAPVLVAVGKAVRSIRVERGMSQEDLAHLAGVDVSYLGRVERGDNNVAIITLQKIAASLGVSVARLIEVAGI